MNVEQLLPVITAALTLANTIVLFFVNRRTRSTHERVNGLVLQQMYEAEARGRRLERHHLRRRAVGE